MTAAEAVRLGLLDDRQETYTNPVTGRNYQLAEAGEAGLVSVDHSTPCDVTQTDVKTYAVRAVVDTRHKTMITFHEAVIGLLLLTLRYCQGRHLRRSRAEEELRTLQEIRFYFFCKSYFEAILQLQEQYVT